jgi:trk system potassium uptake protein TrkA
MYIIVVGGGRLGYYLSKALLNEGHEVLVIDKDPRNLERIEEELGSICLEGDGWEATVLDEAGAERANLLIAVTDEDENNLVACQVAKHKFNVPRTIARLSNPQNEALFKKLGIDVTISSTDLILEHIEEKLPTHRLTHLLTPDGSKLEIIEIKIPPDSSTVGNSISQLSLPPTVSLSLLIRKGEKVQMLAPDTILEPDDRVVVIVPPEDEEALRAALTGG